MEQSASGLITPEMAKFILVNVIGFAFGLVVLFFYRKDLLAKNTDCEAREKALLDMAQASIKVMIQTEISIKELNATIKDAERERAQRWDRLVAAGAVRKDAL